MALFARSVSVVVLCRSVFCAHQEHYALSGAVTCGPTRPRRHKHSLLEERALLIPLCKHICLPPAPAAVATAAPV